jgi:hypothetical protein
VTPIVHARRLTFLVPFLCLVLQPIAAEAGGKGRGWTPDRKRTATRRETLVRDAAEAVWNAGWARHRATVGLRTAATKRAARQGAASRSRQGGRAQG